MARTTPQAMITAVTGPVMPRRLLRRCLFWPGMAPTTHPATTMVTMELDTPDRAPSPPPGTGTSRSGFLMNQLQRGSALTAVWASRSA